MIDGTVHLTRKNYLRVLDRYADFAWCDPIITEENPSVYLLKAAAMLGGLHLGAGVWPCRIAAHP